MPLSTEHANLIAQLGVVGDDLEQPAADLARYLQRNLRNDLGPLMDANGRIMRAHILGDDEAIAKEAATVKTLIDAMQPRLNLITALVTPLGTLPAGMAQLRAWAATIVPDPAPEGE